ncbi:2-keto-4-pentenoate hydratase [Variovorax sp. KK3]|uniref:2-keto-4-pentenoate hydratase n=1 Tax=Variovorax sp. KK3 TaxID=1855728 RepID=UPI00097C96A7|nr:fumarylacetoacetate hydrolase family protein [Variovorax sp. KK3]
MSSPNHDPSHVLAQALLDATDSREPCEPLRLKAESLGWPADEANAYAVQRQVRARRVAGGDRTIGRKIGLTAASVRKQLGVFQPDYGYLWRSTAYGDGATVPLSDYIHPKLEAEVAIVLGKDIVEAEPSLVDLIDATAYALPALEIVDSRVRGWDIRLFDTVADNASAAGFVLGADPRRLDQLSLRDARMTMSRGGDRVSTGAGHECLGHPLNAALWLARQAARCGEPLRQGDIVLTGALGPMVAIARGDRFEASIEGLGRISVDFA